MLNLTSETINPHHDSGRSKVSRDADLVTNVITAVNINPFTQSSDHLISIVTGEHATSEVEYDLAHVKDIGIKSLSKSCLSDHS